MKKINTTVPRYQQFAAEIAATIVSGEFKEGDRVFARSSLATRYGVSSETARRAISILQDLGIVEATKGSGVVIVSFEKASDFAQHFKEITSISDLHEDIIDSAQRQAEEMEYFNEKLNRLVQQTERFHMLNIFTPYKIKITKETPYLNKTISEISFWQNTFATIVAKKKGEDLMISPGPYAALEEGDYYYFIGDQDCFGRVKKFLYPKEN